MFILVLLNMHCDFPKPTCTNIIVCIQVVVIWLCMYEAMHLVYDENHQIASMNQLCWGAVYRWTCSIRTHVCVSVYVYIYRYHFHINKQTTVFIDIFTYHIYRYTDILYVFIYEYYIYIHVFWILEVHMSLTYGGVTHTHTQSHLKSWPRYVPISRVGSPWDCNSPLPLMGSLE